MKQIINGRLYDTSTAKHIKTRNWEDDQLYRKQTGEFFFVRTPNDHGCEYISPVTAEEVKEYLGERYPDAYIKTFGPVPE